MFPFKVVRKESISLLIMLLLIFSMAEVCGQSPPYEDQAAVHSFVTEIYRSVSGGGEEEIEWEKVRSFFAEDAVIVLRTSFDATTHLTVDGFIRDFQEFYQTPGVRKHGFKEEVLSIDSRIYHEMAYVEVIYSATITDGTSTSQKGIDFWLLNRTEGPWKVIAVTNEVITSGIGIPDWIED
jgi:hypothetical protein